MAFPADWGSSHEIQIDNTKVSASLTDFPVLLTEDNFLTDLFDNTLSTGADIRFSSDSAGTTQLAFEIVSFDNGTTDSAEIHVKVPSVSSSVDTSIYVWYNNAGASALPASDTYGSEAVWSDYGGIWHLDSSSTDSDSNGNNGTDTAVTYGTSSGKIGGGGAFNGTTSEIAHSASGLPSGDSALTLNLWVKPTAIGGFDAIFSYGNYITTPGDNGKAFQLQIVNSGKFVIGCWYLNAFLPNNTALTDGEWHMITATVESGVSANVAYYFDGVADGTTTLQAGTRNMQATNGKIAQGYSSAFEGAIDEVRIRSSVPTADWIATEYNNQNSPSTFATAVPAGTAYTKSITENIVLNDTASSRITALLFSEILTLVEVPFSKMLDYFFTETIGVSDTVNKSLVSTLMVTESLSIADIFEIKGTSKKITESLTVTDSISSLFIVSRVLSEAITLVETFSAVKQFNKTLSETLSLVDSLTSFLVAGILLKERLGIADRLFGLLNGINMKYSRKYQENADDYVDKYNDV